MKYVSRSRINAKEYSIGSHGRQKSVLEGVLDYIAEMSDELGDVARRNNRPRLADLLILAGNEARAQCHLVGSGSDLSRN